MGDEFIKYFTLKTQEMKKKPQNRPNQSNFLAGCKCFLVPKRFLSSYLTLGTLSSSCPSCTLHPYPGSQDTSVCAEARPLEFCPSLRPEKARQLRVLVL